MSPCILWVYNSVNWHNGDAIIHGLVFTTAVTIVEEVQIDILSSISVLLDPSVQRVSYLGEKGTIGIETDQFVSEL